MDEEVVEAPKQIVIKLGEEINPDKFPGMPELWEEISSNPVPPERVKELKDDFYPDFSDEQVSEIEHAAVYQFEKFTRYARWVSENTEPKPSIEGLGLTPDSPVEAKMEAIDSLGDNNRTATAFANLQRVEYFIETPYVPPITEQVTKGAQEKGKFNVVDVGCGGQAADIQLLSDAEIIDKDVEVTGVSAFDYGEKLRPGFPKLKDKLKFKHMNIYTDSDQLADSADLVFSVRTAPYTGLVDSVRFCKGLHDIAKEDGNVWVQDIDGGNFDFRNSPYQNLEAYLESRKADMPSLKFSREKGNFTMYWKKSEGFPLSGLAGKSVINNPDNGRPYLVVHGPK